jgi:hypothetical protein
MRVFTSISPRRRGCYQLYLAAGTASQAALATLSFVCMLQVAAYIMSYVCMLQVAAYFMPYVCSLVDSIQHSCLLFVCLRSELVQQSILTPFYATVKATADSPCTAQPYYVLWSILTDSSRYCPCGGGSERQSATSGHSRRCFVAKACTAAVAGWLALGNLGAFRIGL